MKKNKINTNESMHSESGPLRQNWIQNCKNRSSKCAYDCAQLQYTIQHRTVLIISSFTSRQSSTTLEDGKHRTNAKDIWGKKCRQKA